MGPPSPLWTLFLLAQIWLCDASGDLPRYRPVDAVWLTAEDRNPIIEWGAGWDDTWNANTVRWARALERSKMGRPKLEVRSIRLLEALIEKYPEQRDHRLRAYLDIAERFDRLGSHFRAHQFRRWIVEELPEEKDAVIRALNGMLELRKELEDGELWAEYAAEKVLSMERRGALESHHPMVSQARRTLCEVRRLQGRLFDARQALAAVEASGKRDGWRELQEARLIGDTGLVERARALYESILEKMPEESPQRRAAASGLANLFRKRAPSGLGPMFPTDPELATAWETLVNRPESADASLIDRMLRGAGESRLLVPREGKTRVSLWVILDERLRHSGRREPPSAGRARDRAGENRYAPGLVSHAGLLEILRRFRGGPRARRVHEELLEAVEGLLRQGCPEMALRTAEEILARSESDDLRRRAGSARWLALAQLSDLEALEAAFEGVDAKAPFPWIGRQEPAGAIREKLLAQIRPGAASGGGLGDSDASVVRVRLPAANPWPAGYLATRDEGRPIWKPPLPTRIHATGGVAVVAGPECLIVYGEDTQNPRWIRRWPASARRTPSMNAVEKEGWRERNEERRTRVLPGAFRPAAADGRLFARWGLDSSGSFVASIAAFDLEDGSMLWSTLDDSDWRDLWPLCDPRPSEGRLYLLAAPRGPFVPIYALCLNAESGRLLWRSELVSNHLMLPLEDLRIDPARLGDPVTVRGSAVYCSTNAACVARVDARDGLIEWVYTYERVSPHGERWMHMARRAGTPPCVTDALVLVAPRDAAGVIALDRARGELAWENPFLEAHDLRNAGEKGDGSGSAVLASSDRSVALVSARNGEILWRRSLDSPLQGTPAIIGRIAHLSTERKLLSLALSDGRVVREQQLESPRSLLDLDRRRGQLLGLTGEPPRVLEGETSPARRPPAPGPQSGTAARPVLRLPLRRVATLARSTARLVSIGEPDSDGALFAVSEARLERLDARAPGHVLWGRRAERTWSDLMPAGESLLIIHPDRVTAVDAGDGSARWDTRVPFEIEMHALAPPWLAVGQHGGPYWRRDPVGAIDVRDGRLVWKREFDADFPNLVVYGLGWDGESIHVLSTSDWEGDDVNVDLIVRPRDGRLVAARHFLGRTSGWPKGPWCIDRDVFFFAHGRRFGRVSLSGDPRDYGETLRQRGRTGFDERFAFRVQSPWVEVRQRRRGRDRGYQAWFFHRDRARALYRPEGGGLLYQGRLYEVDGGVLRAVDLETSGEVQRYALRHLVPSGRRGLRGGEWRVLAIRESQERLMAICFWDQIEGERNRSPERGSTRIDVFHRESGKHVAGQVLRGVAADASATVGWMGDGLCIAGAAGIHVFSPDPGGSADPKPSWFRVPQSIGASSIDGVLSDSERARKLALHSRHPGTSGSLYLAHADGVLYIALEHAARCVRPRTRGRPHSECHSLELAWTTNRGLFHWAIFLGADGESMAAPLGGGRLPEGLEVATGHSLATGRLIYELAVPLQGNSHERREDSSRMGLSIQAWDGGDGGAPGRPVFVWGQAFPAAGILEEGQEVIELEGDRHSR